MKRDINKLAAQEFDLIVVGGGIFGASAAWDAAARGLKVALLERKDFSYATSNNHFRMIHGGIRYLQHGDIPRVWESSQARSALLRIAPHLVQPLPIVIPTYGHGIKGKEILKAGLVLYDLLTINRNRGIADSTRHIPGGRTLSRRETLEKFPELDRQGLTGAALFHDGQVYHPARLALAFLLSAAQAGAELANYAEVTGFVRSGQRILGVRVCDTLDGNEFEVRGKVVLNAAGPWASRILEGEPELRIEHPTFSRDACLIVRRRLLGEEALTVLGRTSDPDALISRGKRHLFVVPWQDYTLVGVWHVVYKGDPDKFSVTEADIESFLDEMNEAYPGFKLTRQDVARPMAGLTLFGENEEGQTNLSYGHRSQVVDHQRVNGIDGLVTMIGVRFTTAQQVAKVAVDMADVKMGRKSPGSRSETTPIFGGDIPDFAAFENEAMNRRPLGMPPSVLGALLRLHGTASTAVLELVEENPHLVASLGESKTCGAEVVHAVRKEMALKLSDVVFRRTNLGNGGDPGDEALQAAADLMGHELGWSTERRQAEIEEVKLAFPAY